MPPYFVPHFIRYTFGFKSLCSSEVEHFFGKEEVMGPIPIVGLYCSLKSGCEPSVSFALVTASRDVEVKPLHVSLALFESLY